MLKTPPRRVGWLGLVALMLAGCASSPADRVGSAVASPLSDLNLVRQQVPVVLQQARQSPYRQVTGQNCADWQDEVKALDAALGPDFDAAKANGDPSLAERGGQAVGDAAIDAIKGAAEGLLPFRGLVRRLTGAAGSEREAALAVSAGFARRAYLKGVLFGRDCSASAPAASSAASAASAPLAASSAR